ncbi:MAG: hypothetical protein HQK91_00805 [Nitrospirae bacterium]|nr:hypothetical protein [Nitrospirota bacterium]MBF0539977.1 hypothetical protein [Nitrospirota bacterium]
MGDLSGKKIACFIMLPHHTRFLLPVARQIRERGGEVIFFLSLSDYPFERNLIKEGEKYCFINDYVDDEINAKMDALFKDIADDWLDRVFNWHGFSFWSLKKQDWTITQIVEEYYCIEKFINIEKPDMFLALHERNRWGKIIGYLSHTHQIPYVTFQEGDYYAGRLSFNAHTEYSTADLLWGAATFDALSANGCSRDKMVLVGNTHLDEAIKQYNSPKSKAEVRRDIGVKKDAQMILFLVDLTWCVVINKEYWQRFLKGLEGYTCVFKWHPNVNYTTYKEIEGVFNEISSSIKIVLDYNSYALVGACDICVVLGSTTLALESLAFGKTLYAVPPFSQNNSIYIEMGVATAVKPGDWSALRKGHNEDIKENVKKYLQNAFYAVDGNAVNRAVNVMEYMFTTLKNDPLPIEYNKEKIESKVSFIIASGNDPQGLLATLKTLSDNVDHPDWEVILVVSDPAISLLAEDLTGDITILTNISNNLGELYNKGAEQSSGRLLLFIRAGIVNVKVNGLLEIKEGIASGQINKTDNSIESIGYRFDFNSTPVVITDPNITAQALGGGVIAIDRNTFSEISGFDSDLANHLTEIDLSLKATRIGKQISIVKDALFYNYKESFYGLDSGWKSRIRFYTKWAGRMPKDEDYKAYCGDRLNIEAD